MIGRDAGKHTFTMFDLAVNLITGTNDVVSYSKLCLPLNYDRIYKTLYLSNDFVPSFCLISRQSETRESIAK